MSTVSAKQIQELIEKLSQVLLDNYIFPKKAEEMATYIEGKLEGGEYSNFESEDALATQLTTDLRSITQDKHLNVGFNSQAYERIKKYKENPDDNDETSDFSEMMRYRNYGFEKIERLTGNIGYIKFNMFADASFAGQVAIAALQMVAESQAIIFDLRENGGGSPSMIQLISSYLFKESKHLNTFYWRPDDKYNQFWTQSHVQGKKLVDTPVYVLTSKGTFSAAEEFTYNLKHMERATIIGETTGGGAHPGGSEILTENFVIFVPKGRAINPITETNWEGVGVKPHLAVPKEDALSTAHIKALVDILENCEDEAKHPKLEWELATVKGTYNPPELDNATIEAYVGAYDNIQIRNADGHLIYTDHWTSRPLVALSQTLFSDSFNDSVRVEFVVKDGAKAEAIKLVFRDNPQAKTIPRSE